MNARYLLVAILPLLLAACGDGGDQTVGSEGGGTTGQPAEEPRLQKETEELSAAAWDAAKEKAGDYTEKSKEYYESAKEASEVYYEQAMEQTRDYLEKSMSNSEKKESVEQDEQAMEPSRKYYEQAMQQFNQRETLGVKSDVERQESHLPEAGAEVNLLAGAAPERNALIRFHLNSECLL